VVALRLRATESLGSRVLVRVNPVLRTAVTANMQLALLLGSAGDTFVKVPKPAFVAPLTIVTKLATAGCDAHRPTTVAPLTGVPSVILTVTSAVQV
jgi:hypothetical protein